MLVSLRPSADGETLRMRALRPGNWSRSAAGPAEECRPSGPRWEAGTRAAHLSARRTC